MTEKQKTRRNSFAADFNTREDDFILVDLDVALEEESSPVPLSHFLDDEGVMDRLFIDANYNVDDELELAADKSDAIVIDDISLVDELADSDEVVIESVELPEQNRDTEIEEIPVLDIYPVVDSDEITAEEDAIDRLLVDAGFGANDKLELDDGKSDALVVDDLSLADGFADSGEFVVESVELQEQNPLTETEELPISDFHSMVNFDEIPNKGDTIDRLLVGAGFDANDELELDDEAPNMLVIEGVCRSNELDVNFEEQSAMAANAGIFGIERSELELDKDAIGVFLEKKKNPETVNHEQAISETNYPEEALENLNNNAAAITALRIVKIEQENIKKQINDHENKVKKVTIITYTSLTVGIVALLSTMVMGLIVSSMQAKVSKLTELVSILEEDMSGITEKNSDMGINNRDPSIEQLNQKVNGLPERPEEQIRPSSGNSENGMPVNVMKQATVSKSLDNPQARLPVPEKKKPSEAAKNLPAGKNAAGWFVNLTAYEDPGYAKSKAEKFLQKGIPVKVIAVDMNHTTWYRLKVSGFKNKEEASAYAAKIKKSLNLNSVSVDDK